MFTNSLIKRQLLTNGMCNLSSGLCDEAAARGRVSSEDGRAV